MQIFNNETINAGNLNFTQEVETRMQGIFITLMITAGLAYDTFVEKLAECMLSVHLLKDDKQHRVYLRDSFADILDYSSQTGGYAVAEVDGSDNVTKCTFFVPISTHGALPISSNDRFEIEAQFDVAFNSFSMTGHESLESDSVMIEAHNLSVPAAQSDKTFELNSIRTLGIPDTDDIIEISIVGTNGVDARYKMQEIRDFAMVENEAVLVADGAGVLDFGYLGMIYLPVENAASLRITATKTHGGILCMGIEDKVMYPIQKAQDLNSKLTDTTLPKLVAEDEMLEQEA